MRRVGTDQLSLQVVWMPVLGPDDAAAALEAEPILADPRSAHFWDAEQSLGKMYGKVLTLPRGRSLAWDIYFVYAAGVEWKDELPLPTDWQHQLGMDERHLDGEKLREAVVALLPESERQLLAPPTVAVKKRGTIDF